METTQIKQNLRRGANASGLMLILFYALVYAGTFLLHLIMSQFGNVEEGFLADLYNLLAYTFQYPVTVPILLLVFHLTCGRKTGQRLRDCIRKPAVPVKTLVRYLFICLGITYASAYVSRIFWMMFQSLTGLELVAQNFAADQTWLSMLTNLIAMMVYAPIFEEIMFRGTMLRSMEQGGEPAGALLCGILFGLWHTNFDQTLYTAAMGFCAALLYFKTRTLIAPFLLHFTMNTIGAVQSLFMMELDVYEIMEMTDEQIMEFFMENVTSFAVIMLSGLLVMGLIAVGVILLIIELVQHKQFFRFQKSESGMTTGQAMVTCLTSPVLLIACIALLVMTVLRAMGIM